MKEKKEQKIYTAEYFREQGSKGGKKTLEMYGKAHFKALAEKSKKKLSTATPLPIKKKRV